MVLVPIDITMKRCVAVLSCHKQRNIIAHLPSFQTATYVDEIDYKPKNVSHVQDVSCIQQVVLEPNKLKQTTLI